MHDGDANTYAFKFRVTKPPKFKPRKGSEKSLYKSETWVERATSESKPSFFLVLVESKTSEEVKPLDPLA